MSAIPRTSKSDDSDENHAKLKCFPLGAYDNKLHNSLRDWVYHCYCYFYKLNKDYDIYPIFKDWASTCIDEESLIYNAIEDGRSKFLEDLDTARQENKPVRFNYSNEFDFHQYSKLLKNNDRVEMDLIVSKLEIYLEENVC